MYAVPRFEGSVSMISYQWVFYAKDDICLYAIVHTHVVTVRCGYEIER